MNRMMGFQTAARKVRYGGVIRRAAWPFHGGVSVERNGRMVIGKWTTDINLHAILPYSPTYEDVTAKDWYKC